MVQDSEVRTRDMAEVQDGRPWAVSIRMRVWPVPRR